MNDMNSPERRQIFRRMFEDTARLRRNPDQAGEFFGRLFKHLDDLKDVLLELEDQSQS